MHREPPSECQLIPGSQPVCACQHPFLCKCTSSTRPLDSLVCTPSGTDLISSSLSHGRWAWALPLSLQADLGSLPEIENSLAVFCMATYGEGDPTDNAQDFYDWLQETDVDLSGVKYAVSHPIFPPVGSLGSQIVVPPPTFGPLYLRGLTSF